MWNISCLGFFHYIDAGAVELLRRAMTVGVNNLVAGFLWAGFTLANFNMLLLLTPDDQRHRAAALYQTAVFTSAVIGPLIGGYLADNVGYSMVFTASGVGRLLAMLIFAIMGATRCLCP